MFSIFKKIALAAGLALFGAGAANAACTNPLAITANSGTVNMSVSTGVDGFCQYNLGIQAGAVASGAFAQGAITDITNLSTPVAPSTATATKGVLLGTQFNSTQATFTNGQQGAVQGSAHGALYVATGSDPFTIANTGFNITGTLPGFAATPTVNIGTTPTITVTGSVGLTGSPTVTVGNASIPVTESGTWTVGLSSGTNAIGSITNTSFGVTQATAANLNATVVGTGTFAVQATLQSTPAVAIGTVNPTTIGNWGLAPSTQNGTTPTNGHLVMGQFNTTPTAITSGNVSPFQLDTNGNLLVNVKAGGAGGGAVFGPTAVGSANANPPIVLGGTTTGAAGQNVVGAAVKPASTAPLATDTAIVVTESPNSPLVNTASTCLAGTTFNTNTPITTGAVGGLNCDVNGGLYTNGGINRWAGVALGAPSNYGTSPGTVAVQGVNAFITNTVPVTLTSTTITGTVAATQSGTWNVGLSAGSNAIGSITNTTFAATQPTAANLNATVVGTGTFAVQATLQASGSTAIGTVNPTTIGNWGLAASTQNGTTPTNMALMAGQFNTTPTTITNGNVSPLQMTSVGALKTDASATTQPISATSLPLPSGAATSANQSTEIGSLGTIATNSGLQATAANQATANTSLATIATNSAAANPLNVNNTVTAQTGLTPGVAQTGTKVAANEDISSVGGTAVPKGGVPVINGGNTYQLFAASSGPTAFTGGGGGATGDYLSHCTVIPTSTSPGVVTILDNTTAIYSFPGGASSLSNLVPWAIPIGANSISGGWHMTLGAGVSMVCEGKPT